MTTQTQGASVALPLPRPHLTEVMGPQFPVRHLKEKGKLERESFANYKTINRITNQKNNNGFFLVD